MATAVHTGQGVSSDGGGAVSCQPQPDTPVLKGMLSPAAGALDSSAARAGMQPSGPHYERIELLETRVGRSTLKVVQRGEELCCAICVARASLLPRVPAAPCRMVEMRGGLRPNLWTRPVHLVLST